MNVENDQMKIEISKRDNTIAKLEEQVKILDEVKQ